MVVLLGVSTAFVTPFAHQANLIVMGPGNYRFMDYVKVGILLTRLYPNQLSSSVTQSLCEAFE